MTPAEPFSRRPRIQRQFEMSNPPPKHERSPAKTFPLGSFILIALTLPLIALSQYIAHTRIDDIDGWFFLHYGREMLNGATLYADLWDIKPPGIFWINAFGLWVSGGSPTGVWALCAIASVGATALAYGVARQIYNRPTSIIGAVFAAMYFYLWTFHVGCNRPATFLILTELACMGLYLRAITRPQTSNAILVWAGLWGGLGLWFKQTAFAAPAAIVVHLLIACAFNAPQKSIRWRRLAAFAIGYVAAVLTLLLTMWLTNDLRWAWDAIVAFNLNYLKPGVATSLIPSMRWMLPHGRGLELLIILAMATLAQPLIATLQALRHQEPKPSTTDHSPPVLLLFWIWMLFAIYLSAVGPHNRPMYLAVALPPLVLLATHSVSLLFAGATHSASHHPAHVIIVAGLWFSYMLWTPLHMQLDFALRQYHWSTRPPNPQLIAMVNAIQNHSQPTEALFAAGYAPELYWRAGRRQAIRYLGTEKAQHLHQHGQLLMDEITRCLQESKPRIIVFEFKHINSSAPPSAKALEQWVKRHYDRPERGMFPTLWVSRFDRN